MCAWLYSFLLLMIITDSMTNYDDCLRNTTTIVVSCPTDEVERNKSAEQKGCEEYSKNYNCTDDPSMFQYHCVINTNRSQLISVCAESKNIKGHCAEYNRLGNVIQDNYVYDCSEEDDVKHRCPNHYDSVDAYKYKSCYNFSYIFGKKNKITISQTDSTTPITTSLNQNATSDTTQRLSAKTQASVPSSEYSNVDIDIVLDTSILTILVILTTVIIIAACCFKRDQGKEQGTEKQQMLM